MRIAGLPRITLLESGDLASPPRAEWPGVGDHQARGPWVEAVRFGATDNLSKSVLSSVTWVSWGEVPLSRVLSPRETTQVPG